MEDVCDLNLAMSLICEVKIPPHLTIIKIMITMINSTPNTFKYRAYKAGNSGTVYSSATTNHDSNVYLCF